MEQGPGVSVVGEAQCLVHGDAVRLDSQLLFFCLICTYSWGVLCM